MEGHRGGSVVRHDAIRKVAGRRVFRTGLSPDEPREVLGEATGLGERALQGESEVAGPQGGAIRIPDVRPELERVGPATIARARDGGREVRDDRGALGSPHPLERHQAVVRHRKDRPRRRVVGGRGVDGVKP